MADQSNSLYGKAIVRKQGRFVDEYLIDLDGAKAAVRAGYAPKHAAKTALRMLRYPSVKAAVEKRRNDMAARTGITQDRVLKELAKIAFADARTMFDEQGNLKSIHDMDDETAGALSGIDTESKNAMAVEGPEDDPQIILTVTKKVRRHDKVKALELLGKQLGMFADPQQTSTSNFTFVLRDPTERPDGYQRKPLLIESDNKD